MPSVKSFFGLLEKLQSDHVMVHQSRCAVVRNRNASCTRCADACTTGCIAYKDGQLTVLPEKCIGCGTCATVCPTGALEACDPSDADLTRLCLASCVAADGEVVVACDRVLAAAEGLYDPRKVVAVACLGRVEESLLATLASAGARRVTLVRSACDECEHSTGLQAAQQVCETTNTILQTWNQGMHVGIVGKLPSFTRLPGDTGYDASRRGFLAGLKDDAKRVAATTTDFAVKEALGMGDASEPKYMKVAKDGTLPHFVPDRRETLLNNLRSWGDPQDVMVGVRLWGHVVIDASRCSSCQMCATFCPTGAISKFQEKDGSFGVEHAPGACVKCRCCTDICPEEALTLSDEVFAVDVLSGMVERYPMKPRKNPPGNPHQIWHAVKDMLGCDQVYER